MIKLAKPVITGPVTSLINKSIETSIFPDQLKVVQVKPLFKNKNNQLEKPNYHSIRERPFNLKRGGYGFFLKKYPDSQCCWKKNILILVEEKQSDSEFLSL